MINFNSYLISNEDSTLRDEVIDFISEQCIKLNAKYAKDFESIATSLTYGSETLKPERAEKLKAPHEKVLKFGVFRVEETEKYNKLMVVGSDVPYQYYMPIIYEVQLLVEKINEEFPEVRAMSIRGDRVITLNNLK